MNVILWGFTLYDYIVEILVLYLHIEVDRNSIEHQIHVVGFGAVAFAVKFLCTTVQI